MLTKTFCIFDIDDPEIIFWETNYNKLYIKKDEKIIFQSKIDGEQEVQIFSKKLIPNEDLFNNLAKLIDFAITNARKLSEEEIKKNEKSIENIKAIISSVTTFAAYNNISIFEYAARIFSKCLMNHCLINGNKRFSLVFLALMLRSFGYHMFWTKGTKQNYEIYKDDISKFVEQLENKNTPQQDINVSKKWEKMEKNLTEWIKKRVVISIP